MGENNAFMYGEMTCMGGPLSIVNQLVKCLGIGEALGERAR